MPPSIPARARLPQNLYILDSIIYQQRLKTLKFDVASESKIHIYIVLFVAACFAATHNNPLNHIAISLPEFDAAVAWYNDVFGFKMMRTVTVTDRSVAPNAMMFRIYGDELMKVKTAFLTTENGVGVEVFEFMDPPYEPPVLEDKFDYARAGVSHISITTPDVDDTIPSVQAKGARQIGETLLSGRDLEGFMRKAAYIQKQWGTVTELMSVSCETLLADRL